ncbi:MAG: carboxypeptidase regulatory-like domain-containing protein [Planctomycetes bacterium]|nr:carboxypeptidase regulatory-like domain-containing protein [Planctomycetota bacterium]
MRVLAVVALVASALIVAALWFLSRGVGDAPHAIPAANPESADAIAGQEAPAAEAPDPLLAPEERRGNPTDVTCLVRREGAPVPDATLTVLPWSETIELLARMPCGIPLELARASSVRVTSDGGGRALVAASLFPAFVLAQGEGAQPTGSLVSTPPEGELVIDCGPALTVRGRVTLANAGPLAGFPLICRRAVFAEWLRDGLELDAARVAGMLFEIRAESGHDGAFEFAGLAPGSWLCLTYDPRFSTEVVDFTAPSEGEIEVVLWPGARVAGRALDVATGEPVRGAAVTAYYKTSTFDEEGVGWGETDEQGAFEVAVRADGREFGIRVLHPEYAVFTKRLPPIASGERREVTALLARASRIAGRVSATSGEPVASAIVQAWRTDNGDWMSVTRSLRDGSFALPMIDRDLAYVLMAKHEDHQYVTAEGVAAEAEVELVMEPLGEIRGRLVAETAGFLEARVRALTEDDSGTRIACEWADADAATGDFVVSGLPPAVYRVDAFARDFAPALVRGIVVQGGAAKEPLEVRLEAGRALHGVVRDAETGAPIAGAAVSLADLDDTGCGLGVLPPSAVCDGAGTFLLAHAPSTGVLPLWIEGEGYATRVQRIEPDERRERLVEAVLSRPAGLRVQVIGLAGLPLDSLLVWVLAVDQPLRSCSEVRDGWVSFTGLHPGQVDVSAVTFAADGSIGPSLQRKASLVSRETSEVVFSLAPGGRVRGRLTSDTPLKVEDGYEVWAQSRNGGAEARRAIVRPDWSYELASLPPGEYALFVKELVASRNVAAGRIVDVQPGAPLEVDFHLGQRGFRGRVLDPAGKGIAGAELRFRFAAAAAGAPDAPRAAPLAAFALSGGEGAYEAIALPAGEYLVTAAAEGFASEAWRRAVEEGLAPTGLDLELRPEARLRVSCRDRGGAPLPCRGVRVTRSDQELGVIVPPQDTDPAGECMFRRLAQAVYRVEARADGFFRERTEVSCLAGQETPVVLRLRRTARLAVTVKSMETGPVRNAGVRILDLETGESVSDWLAEGLVRAGASGLVTDDAGALLVEGLPEGSYEVECAGGRVVAAVQAAAEPSEAHVLTGAR